MKYFLCLILLLPIFAEAQVTKTTNLRLNLYTAHVDTVRAGSKTDSSEANLGFNNNMLRIDAFYNKYIDRHRDSIRAWKYLRAMNGLTLDASTANLVYWSGASLTDGPGLYMISSNGIRLAPWGLSAGQTTPLQFYDQIHAKYIGFRAPDEVFANTLFTLPDADGDSTFFLGTDGNKNLGWYDPNDFAPDSVRASHKTDTLINVYQNVWKRTTGGIVDLVNPADTVFVGSSKPYNAFLPGKLRFNLGHNLPTYAIIFDGDSGTTTPDNGYFLGRMNTNKRWFMRRSGGSNNVLQTGVFNSVGGIDFYYAMSPSGLGVNGLAVNTFDVAGNMSVSGSFPALSGSYSVYIHNNLQAGYANTTTANLASGEKVSFSSGSGDYLTFKEPYSNAADSWKLMWKNAAITTTTDATPTQVWSHSMNATSDSTAVVEFEVHVLAYRSGGGVPANRGQASYTMIGTFGYENSAVIQIGTTTVVHSAESDAALACVLEASGNVVRVAATGIASENWRWYTYTVRRYAGHLNQ